MRIGIGTAQFGFDYGISNNQGQTSKAEVLIYWMRQINLA
jgi:hypothetical protein